jgi:hypothetical protein
MKTEGAAFLHVFTQTLILGNEIEHARLQTRDLKKNPSFYIFRYFTK